MSIRTTISKIGREIKRPFKKLEQKLRRSAQKFVLKTVEKNAAYLQSALPQQASPNAGLTGFTASSQMDALLLAFLRSQLRRNPGSNFGAIATTNNSLPASQSPVANSQSFTFADASQIRMSLDMRSQIESALRAPGQSNVTLHLTNADPNAPVDEIVADLCPATHSIAVYRSATTTFANQVSTSNEYMIVYKRKAA